MNKNHLKQQNQQQQNKTKQQSTKQTKHKPQSGLKMSKDGDCNLGYQFQCLTAVMGREFLIFIYPVRVSVAGDYA